MSICFLPDQMPLYETFGILLQMKQIFLFLILNHGNIFSMQLY